MTDVCALCLGGSSEVPPFGTAHDAQDFVRPCTCSLVVHRRCLLDWFNSLPAARVSRASPADEDGLAISADDGLAIPADNDGLANGAANAAFPDATDDTFRSISSAFGGINFSGSVRVNMGVAAPSVLEAPGFLSAPCPQCKQALYFRTRASAALGMVSLARAALTDTVQYSAALVALTGAASGVLAVGYAGLARAGASMLDALVPASLLGPLFLRRAPRARPFALSPPAWDNYKQHLIVLFPIVMYRARSASSVVRSDWRDSAACALSEFWVCNYLSSVGDHKLARAVWANMRAAFGAAAADRRHLARLCRPAALARALVANIDWWDPKVLVASMVPVRWAYQLLFRATFNRWYFDLAARARPRDIANTVSPRDLTALQDLSARRAALWAQMAKAHGPLGLWASFRTGGARAGFRSFSAWCGLAWRLVKTSFLLEARKFSACCRHDYSAAFFYSSSVITAVTTAVWPFLAADVGRVVVHLLARRFRGVPRDRLVLAANLLGMVAVALAKDVANCYLSAQKARQITDMAIVRPAAREPASESQTARPTFPGAYRE
ncbi:hypothetical protein EJF18_70347 [Clavispora lusitaniae]|uniref:Uncharacterized protein n=1 Tax=Clavispora lusitaniae TaxID=36911 RepID=A0ACD0WRT4_CLALS|nr:hypothetical protein EJF14_70347 [Clavispora lusitaniae]QFZ35933.1 hypothetical protein EJF16_70347 [Clavispora lusitaniae]QFZ41615.1 hypothetical protein EJF15_70347 [Clavispora lusitaniae]QFZ47293.1 hypothetical protein EJF18_70347 [Clavispora lusitaniae]QFZ52970.1 hypothetical protein EJF17_70347 [Clavispora lusitaniae]